MLSMGMRCRHCPWRGDSEEIETQPTSISGALRSSQLAAIRLPFFAGASFELDCCPSYLRAAMGIQRPVVARPTDSLQRWRR